MASKSRIWDFPITIVSAHKLLSFFEGMYFISVATFAEGMLFSGVVQHFRKFID